MITPADVKKFVSAPATDEDYLVDCLAQSTSLVGAAAGGDRKRIPDVIFDRAVLEVAGNLYYSRNAPNGITGFASMDGVGIRVPLDPARNVPYLFRPFKSGGFA